MEAAASGLKFPRRPAQRPAPAEPPGVTRIDHQRLGELCSCGDPECRRPSGTIEIQSTPWPCPLGCGNHIDPALDGSYSCIMAEPFHCADCHFEHWGQATIATAHLTEIEGSA